MTRALHELERLAFLPASRCDLVGHGSSFADCSLPQALVMDRFEITRGDWLHYYGSPSLPIESGWSQGSHNLPAPLDFAQAQELGVQRGMRLPSAREWMRAAAGPRALHYPWGPVPQRAYANTLELGVLAPVAVGTFERGATAEGCYDLLGNVWEWVTERVPGRSEGLPTGASDRLSAMGGSYLYRRRELYGSDALNALNFDPRTASRDLGARHCAVAAEYLWNAAPHWGEGKVVDEKLFAIGRRWGREAWSLLDELQSRPNAPKGLAQLARGASTL